MLASLRGTVLERHASFFLLEVGGVGYCVKATANVLASLMIGAEIFVYVHDHLREDAHDLYGFLTRSDEELFTRFLSVSGVGPKLALTILSLGSSDTVRRAVLEGDLATLTSVPGVGMKTAQKIVLELKGQIVEEGAVGMRDVEVVEALVSLGYAASAARAAIKSVSPDLVDVADRVREALKLLAK